MYLHPRVEFINKPTKVELEPTEDRTEFELEPTEDRTEFEWEPTEDSTEFELELMNNIHLRIQDHILPN